MGKGIGRYVDSYALAGPEGEQPGDYRIVTDSDSNGSFLLTGGTHMMGGGELLQVAQRVSLPEGGADVRFRVRGNKPVTLYAGVCRKHLLYPAGCMERQVADAKAGSMDDCTGAIARSTTYRRRLVRAGTGGFRCGHRHQAASVEVDNVSLIDASGRSLLTNGDFSSGMQRWFFSSDRSHLPWHIKNMPLHVLFDQGLAGLALLLSVVAGALWRSALAGGVTMPWPPAWPVRCWDSSLSASSTACSTCRG